MSRSQNLEYFYCFDVHCNSFVPLYFCVSTIQLILLPLVTSDSSISIIVSNILYVVGIVYYMMSTMLGYLSKHSFINSIALPFIQKTVNIKKLIWITFMFGIFTVIFQINLAKAFVELYLS